MVTLVQYRVDKPGADMLVPVDYETVAGASAVLMLGGCTAS